MTVSATATGVVYNVTSPAAGATYPLPFPYVDARHVKAYYRHGGENTVLTPGVNYTVTGQDFTSMSEFPVGAVLAIYRETDLTQEILWVDGQAIYAPAIMAADDRLTFITQELARDLARAVKVPLDEPGQTPEELVKEIMTARDEAQEGAIGANDARAWADQSAARAADSASVAEEAAALASGHASMARLWAENPEDDAVIEGHYSALHWAEKSQELGAEQAKFAKEWAEKSQELGEAQADLARQWAENPEDAPVLPGQFSALHWAQKAEAIVSGELLDASPVRRGLVPGGGLPGQVYTVTADGAAYRFENLPEIPDIPEVPAATPATETEPGSAGLLAPAADSDEESRDKAVTPAGMTARIHRLVTYSTATPVGSGEEGQIWFQIL